MKKRGQVGMEYMILIGFLTFIVITILGVALFYTGTIKSSLVNDQISTFANNVISTAEEVFYYGEPSRATISAYLPENVKTITIEDNFIYITFSSNSGDSTIVFESDVLLNGSISTSSGYKKILITAYEDKAGIEQA